MDVRHALNSLYWSFCWNKFLFSLHLATIHVSLVLQNVSPSQFVQSSHKNAWRYSSTQVSNLWKGVPAKGQISRTHAITHGRASGTNIFQWFILAKSWNSTKQNFDLQVKCPVCDKGYTKRYHVRKHLKNFHKILEVDAVLGSRKRGFEREPVPYQSLAYHKLEDKVQIKKEWEFFSVFNCRLFVANVRHRK